MYSQKFFSEYIWNWLICVLFAEWQPHALLLFFASILHFLSFFLSFFLSLIFNVYDFLNDKDSNRCKDASLFLVAFHSFFSLFFSNAMQRYGRNTSILATTWHHTTTHCTTMHHTAPHCTQVRVCVGVRIHVCEYIPSPIVDAHGFRLEPRDSGVGGEV